jgi:hypothetical protein
MLLRQPAMTRLSRSERMASLQLTKGACIGGWLAVEFASAS